MTNRRLAGTAKYVQVAIVGEMAQPSDSLNVAQDNFCDV
jgi:hypothetical protein